MRIQPVHLGYMVVRIADQPGQDFVVGEVIISIGYYSLVGASAEEMKARFVEGFRRSREIRVILPKIHHFPQRAQEKITAVLRHEAGLPFLVPSALELLESRTQTGREVVKIVLRALGYESYVRIYAASRTMRLWKHRTFDNGEKASAYLRAAQRRRRLEEFHVARNSPQLQGAALEAAVSRRMVVVEQEAAERAARLAQGHLSV